MPGALSASLGSVVEDPRADSREQGKPALAAEIAVRRDDLEHPVVGQPRRGHRRDLTEVPAHPLTG